MKKAFFISDIHLGASHNLDTKEVERKVVAFLDSIKNEASELYLLGDILDYWFEYKHVVPRGYVRFFGKLAELSDSGVKITWMIGNHDIWIFDYIPSELGVEVIDGVLHREIMGTPFCIQHGDGVGGTSKFIFMRNLFRNRLCQKLYSGIHPRWTVGFAMSCSNRSRKKGGMRPTKSGNLIEKYEEWCNLKIEEGDRSKIFLFGHLHQQHEIPLREDRELIVMPDWPVRNQYGMFDGKRFSICSFEGK